MRRLIIGALLLAGCQDYDKLRKGFCDTATMRRPNGKGGIDRSAVAFCDDFEEGSAIDTNRWQTSLAGGTLETVAIDGSLDRNSAPTGTPFVAYRGHRVLHASVGAMQEARLIESVVTSKQGTPAIRFFYWPGDSPSVGTFDLVDFVDAEGKSLRTVSVENGFPVITEPSTGLVARSGLAFFPDFWACIEIDNFTNRLDVSVDRKLSTNFLVMLGGLTTPSQAAEIRLGPKRGADAAPTTDVWLDEVIIDNVPVSDDGQGNFDISCDP